MNTLKYVKTIRVLNTAKLRVWHLSANVKILPNLAFTFGIYVH